MENQISREEILNYLQNALPPVRQIEDCLIKKNDLQNQANQNANTIESNKSLTLGKSILSAVVISAAVLACTVISLIVSYLVYSLFSWMTSNYVVTVILFVFDVLLLVVNLVTSRVWRTRQLDIKADLLIVFAAIILVAHNFPYNLKAIAIFCLLFSLEIYTIIYDRFRKNKTRGEGFKEFIAYVLWILFFVGVYFVSSKTTSNVLTTIAILLYFPLPIVYSIYLDRKLKSNNTKLSDNNEQISQEIAALDNQSQQIYSQNIELIGDIPDNYCNVYSLEHLYEIINNSRADNLKDAINIFEQDEHNRQMQEIAAQNAEALREAQMRIDMLENEVGRLNSEVASAQGRARRAESKARQAKSDANFSMWYNAMK